MFDIFHLLSELCIFESTDLFARASESICRLVVFRFQFLAVTAPGPGGSNFTLCWTTRLRVGRIEFHQSSLMAFEESIKGAWGTAGHPPSRKYAPRKEPRNPLSVCRRIPGSHRPHLHPVFLGQLNSSPRVHGEQQRQPDRKQPQEEQRQQEQQEQ